MSSARNEEHDMQNKEEYISIFSVLQQSLSKYFRNIIML